MPNKYRLSKHSTYTFQRVYSIEKNHGNLNEYIRSPTRTKLFFATSVIRIGLLNNSNMHWTLPPLFQMKRMNGFASEIATYIYGNIDVHKWWCCAYISKLPRKSAVSLSTQGQGYSNVLDKIHCQVHDEGHSTIEKKFNWFWNVEHLKH